MKNLKSGALYTLTPTITPPRPVGDFLNQYRRKFTARMNI